MPARSVAAASHAHPSRDARPQSASSTVYFIHLQKTGGTSIRHAAREQFGPDRALMLYGSRSEWTSPAAAEIMYRSRETGPAERLARLADYIEDNDIAFFSSHQSAPYLRCFDPARAFTILRDPVERVLSQYYFFLRTGRTEQRLEAFIERNENRNVQARVLRSVDLGALAAVGILERYEAFVAHLNGLFGWDFAVVHRKRGGLLKDVRSRMVGASLRRRIEALNQRDAALYARATEIAPS